MNKAAPFNPTIRRAPMYPLFLVAFPADDLDSTKWITLVQAMLDAAVAAIILHLALFVTNLGWATIASIVYAIHPGAINASRTVLSEPLFTFLMVVGLLAVVSAFQRDRIMLSALGGLTFGLATICRPISLSIPFVLVAVSFFYPNIPRRWLHGALLIGCAALAVLPWTVRCTRVSQQLVVVQGVTPVLFYVATHFEWDQKDEERLWKRFAEEDPYGFRLSAAKNAKEMADADRYGLRLALQNLRMHPVDYLISRVKSFPYLFISSFDTFSGVNRSFRMLYSDRDISRLLLKITLLVLFSLVPFLLAVLGAIWGRRYPVATLCASVWLYTLIISFPMWIEYRYWVPAVPFMLVSAARGSGLLASTIRALASGLGTRDPAGLINPL